MFEKPIVVNVNISISDSENCTVICTKEMIADAVTEALKRLEK